MRRFIFFILTLFITLQVHSQGEIGMFTRDGQPFLYPYQNILRVHQLGDGSADIITVHPEMRGQVDENFHDVISNSCGHLFEVVTLEDDTLGLNPRYIDRVGINSSNVTYIIYKNPNKRYQVQDNIITLGNLLSQCADSSGVSSGGDGYLVSGQLLGDSTLRMAVGGQDSVDIDVSILARDTQQLSWNEAERELTIDRGNTVTIADKVNDADSVIGNEFQDLELSDGFLSITDGNSVNLNPFYDNTDSQILVFDSTTQLLTISGGNSVTLNIGGGDDWGSQAVLSDTTLLGTGIVGDTLRVDTTLVATRSYVDSNVIPNTDDQLLSWNDNLRQLTIENGNTVTIPAGSFGDDWGSQVVIHDLTLLGEGTATNPLSVDTTIIPTFNDISDDQTLNWNSGNGELSIENGNTVILNLSDSGDNWGNQVVVSDSTIQGTGISADPLSVDSTIMATIWYVDSSVVNGPDSQSLSWNEPSHELTITRGNTVNIPDNQELSWNDNLRELTIEDGNTVVIPSGADDWGNQVALTDQTILGDGSPGFPLRVDSNNLIATKWDLTQIESPENLYTTDDTIINNRTVAMLNRDLTFDEVGKFKVVSDYSTANYGHAFEVSESSVGDELDFIFWGNDQYANDPTKTSNSEFLVSVDEYSLIGNNFTASIEGDYTINTDDDNDGSHGSLLLQIPGHELADTDSSFVLTKIDVNGNAIWRDAGAIVDGDNWGSQVAITDLPITGDGTAGNPIGLDTAWLDTSGVGDDWGDQVAITDLPITGDGTAGNPLGLDTAWLDTSGVGDDWGDQVAITDLPITGDGTAGNPLGLDTAWLDTSGVGDDWGDQVVESDNTLIGTGIIGNVLGVDTSWLNGFIDTSIIPYDLQGLAEDQLIFGNAAGNIDQNPDLTYNDSYLKIGTGDELRINNFGVQFEKSSGNDSNHGLQWSYLGSGVASLYGRFNGSTLEDVYISNYPVSASNSVFNLDMDSERMGIGGVDEPTRLLDVNGEARIRDLITTQATKIVGADTDGVLSDLVLGPGVSISNDTLTATSNVSGLNEDQLLFGDAAGNIDQHVKLQYNDTRLLVDTGKLRINAQLGSATTNPFEIYDISGSSRLMYYYVPAANNDIIYYMNKFSGANVIRIGTGGANYIGTQFDNITLGINTNSASRDFDVDGEARIRDLTTTQATVLLAADADGVLSDLVLGDGVSISNDTLIVTASGTDDQTLTLEDSPIAPFEISNFDLSIENGNSVDLPMPELQYVNRQLSITYGSASSTVNLDTVPFGTDTSIYKHDGSLDSHRTVDFATNDLTFSNIGAFNLQVPGYNTTAADSSMVLSKIDNNGNSVWKDIDELTDPSASADSCWTLYKTGATIDLEEHPYVYAEHSFSSSTTVTFTNPLTRSGKAGVYNIRLVNNAASDITVGLSGFTFYNEDGTTFSNYTVPAGEARVITFAVPSGTSNAYTME